MMSVAPPSVSLMTSGFAMVEVELDCNIDPHSAEGREALDALREDMSFLTKGDVFTEDQIEAYIDLKMEEVVMFEHAPHPVEFKMYYSS